MRPDLGKIMDFAGFGVTAKMIRKITEIQPFGNDLVNVQDSSVPSFASSTQKASEMCRSQKTDAWRFYWLRSEPSEPVRHVLSKPWDLSFYQWDLPF